MAVTVKRITLWRADVDNHPGALARTLEPLAQAGAERVIVSVPTLAGDEARRHLDRIAAARP